jgi:steroid 5-alpha reductase family enzyme
MDTNARKRGLWHCLWIYLVALLAAIVTVRATPGMSLLARAGLADVVATLVVFLASRLLRNSSFYDPYWSVAPPILALYWLVAAFGGWSGPGAWPPAAGTVRAILVTALIWYWAVRLTANWIRRWRGTADEDWRYLELKKRAGGFEWVVDLVGIQLFPTAQVFLGSLGIYVVMTNVGSRASGLGLLDALGLAITVSAILLETVADRQLIRFRTTRSSDSEILTSGIWGVVRHPNYLGEILFWWGMWVFATAAAPFAWWTLTGPVAMTALFVFVSVPWMDRHLEERYPAYREHRESTSALIPRVY